MDKKLVACEKWEYETNDNVGNTWTSQWDLVCEKEHLKNVAEMFFLLGVATGGIISGYLSDKFGRKTMLFISAVLQTIFGECLLRHKGHFILLAHTHTHTTGHLIYIPEYTEVTPTLALTMSSSVDCELGHVGGSTRAHRVALCGFCWTRLSGGRCCSCGCLALASLVVLVD